MAKILARLFKRRQLTRAELIEKRDKYQDKIDGLNKEIGLPWSRITKHNRHIKSKNTVH